MAPLCFDSEVETAGDGRLRAVGGDRRRLSRSRVFATAGQGTLGPSVIDGAAPEVRAEDPTWLKTEPRRLIEGLEETRGGVGGRGTAAAYLSREGGTTCVANMGL
jgi:hypothetical protein